MFNLFMSYANQYKIKQAGIYRYRFQTKEISCFEVYQMLVHTVIQKPDRYFFDYELMFLEAIFLIQTIDDIYYCTIFFNEAPQDHIVIFENFLKSHAIKYEVYIENQSNTETYQKAWDVEYVKKEDDLPFYSYRHWLTDITGSEINKYILLQLLPYCAEYVKTNIYFKSQAVINLINLDNFYYLDFFNCGIPADPALFIETVAKGKGLTLKNNLMSTNEYKRVLKPIKYDDFKEYMTYKSHTKSQMPIIYVGIIDATLRQNFQILYTNIKLENTCITKLYNLFNVEFGKLTEAVVMFKPKEHTIFFMLNLNCNENYNELQKLLTNLNSNAKLKLIEELNYNYCDSIYDCNRVYIEINSLAVGLYTKDANYWSTFYDILNTELHLTDAYFKSVEEEDIEFRTKFFDGYIAFIQHNINHDVETQK